MWSTVWTLNVKSKKWREKLPLHLILLPLLLGSPFLIPFVRATKIDTCMVFTYFDIVSKTF